MVYRSESGLFHALEVVLKDAKEPLTCVQIYDDNASIRELAKTPNRVSDYLGGLWRKGQVRREPAPKINNSSARWAYSWNKTRNEVSEEVNGQAQEFVDSFKPGAPAYKKANVEIFDNGRNVTIELPNFTITISQKR